MQEVLDYLKANQKRFIEELCDYLRFPSISAQPEHQGDLKACATWLRDHCKAIGMKARLHPTTGNPILVARTPRKKNSKKPHFLIYGHYDVQPPDPLEKWTTPPFEPRIANGNIYGRGTSDNKGQNFAHIKAVEAFLKTGTELPCDLTFVIEGEEEVGSEGLAPFLSANKKDFACDGIVISDSGMPSTKHPALTYALRGVAAMEVLVEGPNKDLHSGIFGGCVDNPAMVLSQMLGSLRDESGKIAIPGFYTGVKALRKKERESFARLPVSANQFKRLLGVKELFGEEGFSHHEQRAARPTLEINGLNSGYQGEGSKTIVPSQASAKLTMRLVPDQDPQKVLRLVAKHLKKICPKSVKLTIEMGHAGEPYIMDPDSALAKAGLRSLKNAFGREPVMLREGGSIPIVSDFKRILKADSLLLGLGLPDDNLHSPNEKFCLENFAKGMHMSADLWKQLGNL